jgi:DNA primase
MSLFDFLKDRVELDQIVSANGTGKARCVSPDHEDGNPSMHLFCDHAHCFACGFHGDVTDVWAAMRGFDRPVEAALDLAREFSVQLPEFSEEGRKKAKQRRLQEDTQYALAKEYHDLLEEDARAREWWKGRGFDDDLQKRFLLGGTTGAATIPFFTRGGRVAGVIERRYEGESKKYIVPKAEDLPDGRKPLFIPAPLGREIHLTESYTDALAVAATGKSVIAVGGTNASEEQIAELRKIARSSKVYILPHRDEGGAIAATTWARALYPAARICPADYGEGRNDAADLFAATGVDGLTEHLNRLISQSEDVLDMEMESAAKIEDRRERLAYVAETIGPLLATISPDAMQDATADLVADTVKLKKNWITKAIKAAVQTRMQEKTEKIAAEMTAEMQRREAEYRAMRAEAQPEIDTLLAPGVLCRLREAAAKMHKVVKDEKPLELGLLVALGAQLEPLPNGRPLGASILLTGQPGRGKNHIADAACKPLPEEFYFAFEIASGQSLYYEAGENPEFLKHTFAYPNEIEGAEDLWEFLRPMLSKGKAHKIVTVKDADGNLTTRHITVEGPVTIAIPTIRNKTDEQLQTRLLIAELPDYPGRVKDHSAAISEQLHPDAATADYERERWLWQEGLRSLTEVRRVVFPLKHENFALDDDQISHGARLWANLLSLMATNAWLEQTNRQILDLGEGGVAIEAIPDDYEVAYRIFNAVCKRTVVNLSDTHRKILNATYDLHQEFPNRGGFTQRMIKEEGGVSQAAVSDNKTFLVMSAKLMKETEDGLALVEGADPSWWTEGDLMQGFPTPAQVRSWWEDRDGGPKTADHGDHGDHADRDGSDPHSYADIGDRHPADRSAIGDRQGAEPPETSDHDRLVIGDPPIGESLIDTAHPNGEATVIGTIGDIGPSQGNREDLSKDAPEDDPGVRI